MKRIFIAFAALAVSLAAHAVYPDHPIKLIVPFGPGGFTDVAARILQKELQPVLGQPVVIENKAGAGSTIGTADVAKAAPDGYTLLLASLAQLTINPSLYDKMPFDTVKDVIPITQAVFTPNILALNNDVPAKSITELVALARAQPGQLTFGSAGPGSMHHLSTELLQSLAGIQMTHVPYKATPPAMNDLIAGHIQVLFGDTTSTLPMIQQGRLRGIAVSTAKRSPAAMDVPAVAETVPGFESASWQMLVAPGATPPDVIALLNREIHTIFSDPATINELERRGIGPALTGTPEETNAFVKKEIVRWRGVVQRAGLEGSQ